MGGLTIGVGKDLSLMWGTSISYWEGLTVDVGKTDHQCGETD